MATILLTSVNPAPPSPFVDKQGRCTVAAQSLLNQLTAEHNLLAMSGANGTGSVTAALAKLTTGGTNGSLTIAWTVQSGILLNFSVTAVEPT